MGHTIKFSVEFRGSGLTGRLEPQIRTARDRYILLFRYQIYRGGYRKIVFDI